MVLALIPKPLRDNDVVKEPLVIVIGHAALDSVYRIRRFPVEPCKVQALEHIEAGGGSAANAAAAVAHLGGRVEFWSRVGADDTGRRILAALEADGVSTQFVCLHEGARSSHAAVIVDERGERLIVSERDHAMPAETGRLPLGHIENAAVVVSDLRWLEATSVALERARAARVPTVLDIDVGGGNNARGLVALADYPIFSALGLAAFAGEGSRDDQLRRVLDLGVPYAGVTLGAEGYAWRSSDGAFGFQRAFKAEVVDSTGAGDAFHGAFAWALAHGNTHQNCARIASAAAALSLRKLGARRGLPSRIEVAALMDRANLET